MSIYLDNAATTPILPAVKEEMIAVLKDYHGNPSSIHAAGRQSRVLIEKARKVVANYLTASVGEVFFTSGGTESNNMALKCAVRDLGVKRIISSGMEHHCVLHTLEDLAENCGTEVILLDYHPQTAVDLDQLSDLLSTSDTPTLVSLMHSNNETGAMIDLHQVSALVKEHGAYFHTDTIQTVGHFRIDVSKIPIDFLTGSAHKFYGPKGAGFIYINGDLSIKSWIHGGSQERTMRAGTENLYGIAGLAKALELAESELDERYAQLLRNKNYFLDLIKEVFPTAKVVAGESKLSNPRVANISFAPNSRSSTLLMLLDIAGICVSGGSACSSGSQTGSHVLKAMGECSERTAVRFSFSHLNTTDEIDQTVTALTNILREASPVV